MGRARGKKPSIMESLSSLHVSASSALLSLSFVLSTNFHMAICFHDLAQWYSLLSLFHPGGSRPCAPTFPDTHRPW